MASRFELVLWASVVLGLGCKPVLPATPPEEDPTDPEAPATEWKAPGDALSRSAFEGVKLDKGGHRHHHGHGAKAEEKKPEKEDEQ